MNMTDLLLRSHFRSHVEALFQGLEMQNKMDRRKRFPAELVAQVRAALEELAAVSRAGIRRTPLAGGKPLL